LTATEATGSPRANDTANRPQVPVQKFFATTVALITSYAEGKGANVMACEWTLNVSYQPLRVLSVIERGDYTHELITASGQFGVNLCSSGQAALSHLAGSASGRDGAKLAHPLFADRTYSARRLSMPMLRGCVLNAECVVEQTFEIGAHTGFIGRAVAARVNPRLRPLLYHQSRYFELGELISKPADSTAVSDNSANSADDVERS
jgi:flavin reductase (DIM6/NTAB) family NADH-FMN oxidoreductase RutF